MSSVLFSPIEFRSLTLNNRIAVSSMCQYAAEKGSSSFSTTNTKRLLGELSNLKPETLAIMHGSTFKGNGGRLLQELDPILKEVFGSAK